jgi:hypothetical protein
MTDILNYVSTWSVLQWVILVLIAGFIGQFGRTMAESIIARMRRRRFRQNQSLNDSKKEEAQAVLPADVSMTDLSQKPAESSGIIDKKTLKAMAKARKKEEKKRFN